MGNTLVRKERRYLSPSFRRGDIYLPPSGEEIFISLLQFSPDVSAHVWKNCLNVLQNSSVESFLEI